jgi:type VI secretion system secreted protein VgrG
MSKRILAALPIISIALAGALSLHAQDFTGLPDAAAAPTTVTNATGTISQLNYGSNGVVEGFLLGTNILLTFPGNVSAGVTSLGAAGNSVTYSGTSVTSTSGFQSVRVTSFTNNTTKATFSSSTPPSTSTAYGPTSGTIKQLNYGGDGTVDGFVFAPSGSTTPLFVDTGAVTVAALKSALTVGATVSVTGTTHTPTTTMCTMTGALTVVDASSLAIGGTTYVLTGGGNGGGPVHGGGHR